MVGDALLRQRPTLMGARRTDVIVSVAAGLGVKIRLILLLLFGVKATLCNVRVLEARQLQILPLEAEGRSSGVAIKPREVLQAVSEVNPGFNLF